MAFTVSRDTIENNAPLFIRDVLRTNLTDPLGTRNGSDWIVKSPVKNEEISFPMVIIDKCDVDETEITFGGAVETTIRIGMMIWSAKSDAIKYRDQLGQEIKAILRDKTKSDGSSTMHAQGLGYRTSSTTLEDGYIKGFSELIRIKAMDFVFIFMK